jgi:hypothetical protein
LIQGGAVPVSLEMVPDSEKATLEDAVEIRPWDTLAAQVNLWRLGAIVRSAHSR